MDGTCGAYERDMHAGFLWGGKGEEERFKIQAQVRLQYNIKMNVIDIRWEDVFWTNLAREKDLCCENGSKIFRVPC